MYAAMTGKRDQKTRESFEGANAGQKTLEATENQQAKDKTPTKNKSKFFVQPKLIKDEPVSEEENEETTDKNSAVSDDVNATEDELKAIMTVAAPADSTTPTAAVSTTPDSKAASRISNEQSTRAVTPEASISSQELPESPPKKGLSDLTVTHESKTSPAKSVSPSSTASPPSSNIVKSASTSALPHSGNGSPKTPSRKAAIFVLPKPVIIKEEPMDDMEELTPAQRLPPAATIEKGNGTVLVNEQQAENSGDTMVPYEDASNQRVVEPSANTAAADTLAIPGSGEMPDDNFFDELEETPAIPGVSIKSTAATVAKKSTTQNSSPELLQMVLDIIEELRVSQTREPDSNHMEDPTDEFFDSLLMDRCALHLKDAVKQSEIKYSVKLKIIDEITKYKREKESIEQHKSKKRKSKTPESGVELNLRQKRTRNDECQVQRIVAVKRRISRSTSPVNKRVSNNQGTKSVNYNISEDSELEVNCLKAPPSIFIKKQFDPLENALAALDKLEKTEKGEDFDRILFTPIFMPIPNYNDWAKNIPNYKKHNLNSSFNSLQDEDVCKYGMITMSDSPVIQQLQQILGLDLTKLNDNSKKDKDDIEICAADVAIQTDPETIELFENDDDDMSGSIPRYKPECYSIGIQTVTGNCGPNSVINADLPLMSIIENLNNNQLLALNDFAELISTTNANTASEIHKLRERMVSIYQFSQLPPPRQMTHQPVEIAEPQNKQKVGGWTVIGPSRPKAKISEREAMPHKKRNIRHVTQREVEQGLRKTAFNIPGRGQPTTSFQSHRSSNDNFRNVSFNSHSRESLASNDDMVDNNTRYSDDGPRNLGYNERSTNTGQFDRRPSGSALIDRVHHSDMDAFNDLRYMNERPRSSGLISTNDHRFNDDERSGSSQERLAIGGWQGYTTSSRPASNTFNVPTTGNYGTNNRPVIGRQWNAPNAGRFQNSASSSASSHNNHSRSTGMHSSNSAGNRGRSTNRGGGNSDNVFQLGNMKFKMM